jgi:DNA-binding response OmpR family regulator
VQKERIKAVLRRRADENIYSFKDLEFDFDKLCLTKSNINIPVTKIEVRLLELFVKNKGRVLTREQILDKIWDIDGEFVDENTVSVNIRRLRTKIEDNPSDPSLIKTVFGIGYLWGDDN